MDLVFSSNKIAAAYIYDLKGPSSLNAVTSLKQLYRF